MEAEKVTDVAADDAKYHGYWNIAEEPSSPGCWELIGGVVRYWTNTCHVDFGTAEKLKLRIDRGDFVRSQWLPPHARQPDVTSDAASDDKSKYYGKWNLAKHPWRDGWWEYNGGAVYFVYADGSSREKPIANFDELKERVDLGFLVRQPEPVTDTPIANDDREILKAMFRPRPLLPSATGWVDAAKQKPPVYEWVIVWAKGDVTLWHVMPGIPPGERG